MMISNYSRCNLRSLFALRKLGVQTRGLRLSGGKKYQVGAKNVYSDRYAPPYKKFDIDYQLYGKLSVISS